MAKRRRRKAVARGRRVARRRRARLGGISGAVRSLQSYRAELMARQAELSQQLQAVDQALAVMEGARTVGRAAPPPRAARPARRRRVAGGAVRPGSLKAYVLDVLSSGQTMAVKDITAEVLKAGYKTKNKTLAKSVGIALTQLPQVKKVGRGRFRLK